MNDIVPRERREDYFREIFYWVKQKRKTQPLKPEAAEITINYQVSIIDFSPYLRPLKIVLNT